MKKKSKPKTYAEEVIEAESDSCEHVFLPIDSTKKILACSKCGLVINKDKSPAKPKNPFL